MGKRNVTIHILLYLFGLLTCTAGAGIVVYFQGTENLIPVICIWLLASIFCIWKVRFALHYRHTYRPGEWTVADLDSISGEDFEILTCDILAANGFDIAENTQLSVDFGVDVLARKDGITYAIQCKRYQTPVGIEAVQQVYAGRAYYECHVAMVLTNQTFTSSARKLADKLGVVLWGRNRLEEML